jgi:predicted nucleic acid-binding protein
MVALDTSILVDSLTGARLSLAALHSLIERGDEILLSSFVLDEWLRGPRTPIEIANQQRLFPAATAVPFTTEDAALSVDIYRSLGRARSREIDIAIAAIAIHHDAALWTLNVDDFADIPGLRLHSP